ncbi:MAG: hypothetical protein QM503_04665 [Bacteroidota bacterium]
MEKRKIIIIDASNSGKTSLSNALNKVYPEEPIIMTIDEAKEKGIEVVESFKITARPDPMLNMSIPFMPSSTRAERRKAERKKIKHPNN